MENLFLKVFIIEEFANIAVITSKFDTTVVARLFDLNDDVYCTYRLYVIAFYALDLFSSESVELMCLFDIRLI